MGVVLCAMPALLVWNFALLQVIPREESKKSPEQLNKAGDARTLRKEAILASRGIVTDRNGKLLAVSTPIKNVVIDPQVFDINDAAKLAKVLNLSKVKLVNKISAYKKNVNKRFAYIKRKLPPHEAERIAELSLTGVFFQDDFQRFYPAGEVTSHIVGFTNIEGYGQEGLELSLDSWLRGEAGSKLYIKDRKGKVVKDLGYKSAPKPGNNLSLSIDLRLQYLAYRELKTAVAAQKAKSGSAVILDVATGDILAMVNQPSYNPNDRSKLKPSHMRNRAVTDVIEPGSTVKPLTVLAALESGRYGPRSVVDTSPGWIMVGNKRLKDSSNHRKMNLEKIIQKSSQVGTVKLALDLQPGAVRDLFFRFGFGQSTGIGFPGESIGVLPNRTRWAPIETATLSFGHGLSVTPLQLAQAYLTIASKGKFKNVSIIRNDEVTNSGQVVDAKYADQVLQMMKSVTQRGGTAPLAQINAYPTAGKTGTAHKVGKSGYEDHKYVAIFAGIAPVGDPNLVTVVVINEPSTEDHYYGGEAAAPVYASITEGALRLRNVPPYAAAQRVAKR